MKLVKQVCRGVILLAAFLFALWLLPMDAHADTPALSYDEFVEKVEDTSGSNSVTTDALDHDFEWPTEAVTITVRNEIYVVGDWEIPSNVTLAFPSEKNNNGSISGGTLTVKGTVGTSSAYVSLSCDVVIASGGTVCGESISISRGTLTVQSGGTLSASSISLNYSTLTVQNGGTLSASSITLMNSTLTGTGTVDGYVDVRGTADSVISGTLTLTNEIIVICALTIPSGSSITSKELYMVNEGTATINGTLSLTECLDFQAGGGTVTINGTLSPGIEVSVDDGTTATINGTLSLASGCTMDMYPGSAIVKSSGYTGKITGNGVIYGRATQKEDGTYTDYPSIYGTSIVDILKNRTKYSANVAEEIVFDCNWFDGTTAESLVGSSVTQYGITYKVTDTSSVKVSKVSSKSVTSVTIPSTVWTCGKVFRVTSIGASAFSGCTKLKKVTIGSNVTSIGSKAFYNCKALTTVTIPASVTEVGSSAFAKCVKLSSVKGCAGLTSVGASTFSGCTALKTVRGFKKVTTIGNKAFYNCKILTAVGSTAGTVTLAKVKTIGTNAFYGCKKLKKVNLTSTALTSIGAYAFKNCTAMTSFVSKSTKLTTIGKQAFYGDKKLASITLKTTKLESSKVGANAFKNIKSTCKFKVPSSKVSAYKKIFKARGASSSIKVTK